MNNDYHWLFVTIKSIDPIQIKVVLNLLTCANMIDPFKCLVDVHLHTQLLVRILYIILHIPPLLMWTTDNWPYITK